MMDYLTAAKMMFLANPLGYVQSAIILMFMAAIAAGLIRLAMSIMGWDWQPFNITYEWNGDEWAKILDEEDPRYVAPDVIRRGTVFDAPPPHFSEGPISSFHVQKHPLTGHKRVEST